MTEQDRPNNQTRIGLFSPTPDFPSPSMVNELRRSRMFLFEDDSLIVEKSESWPSDIFLNKYDMHGVQKGEPLPGEEMDGAYIVSCNKSGLRSFVVDYDRKDTEITIKGATITEYRNVLSPVSYSEDAIELLTREAFFDKERGLWRIDVSKQVYVYTESDFVPQPVSSFGKFQVDHTPFYLERLREQTALLAGEDYTVSVKQPK